MNNLEFALEMKNKRLASGLSQGELASLTHVSRYSINRFENGKANASKETQNIILRCLNYYVCDKPFYLLVDYLSVRFPTTDELEVIRKVLGMKADYFIHYNYGYYGYKEHYAYGEIKVMASDDEHMGVFLELKGAGSRNMEYVLQAQNRDWYSYIFSTTSFSTAMVSMETMLPSEYFSSTQVVSMLNSQEISFFMGCTSKI